MKQCPYLYDEMELGDQKTKIAQKGIEPFGWETRTRVECRKRDCARERKWLPAYRNENKHLELETRLQTLLNSLAVFSPLTSLVLDYKGGIISNPIAVVFSAQNSLMGASTV